MNQDTKYAGALIAFGVLCVLTGFSVWLAWNTHAAAYIVDPDELESELLFPWRIATFFMELGTGINAMLAGVFAIVTAVTGWMTEIFAKRWQLAAIIVLCVAGLLSIIYTMVEIGTDGLSQLRFYGELYTDLPDQESIAETTSAFRAFGSQLIAAFSFFLASRLGISIASDGGRVRQFIGKTLGKDDGE
ncbi:hypothetical protein HKD42_04680 [Altererythrobacter sp. RZ02]|uniref:Uncharacterized protein n=1 Tax=Pontixanthobacter rizhaonensis TaxID=2730337 RepID=A0A848QL59_9SPHN|nr:hypothetical protein [Pontixanthobacter rizhaonensis]NMW31347.1 hypothetical protein [Pontixanthobacter rizhaonensis]